MGERMEIGHDLDLFLNAARLVISRRSWSGRPLKVVTQNSIQRHIRVGFVKAGHLLLLLEDFGIIAWSGPSRYACTVEAGDLEARLTEIREASATELARKGATGG
jgi:hypothetical protein